MMPGWYALVMGLAGLSLAWHRAVPLLGEMAGAAALLVGVLAAAVFALLAVATVIRGQRYPEAWAEDRRHPVRHTFIAALPVAVLLLATVGVAVAGPPPLLLVWWWGGALAQLFVTWWVLARWWRPAAQGGLQWASVTPALFVAIVGNVLVPLAGVPLGQAEWSAAQFGLGLLFWPLATVLVLVRIAVQGLWPERLLPTAFIFIAPPAVVGLAVLQFGAPLLLAWVLWGMAMFTLLWVSALAPRIAKLPFGLPHWAISFPLAAIAALTLRLALPGSAMAGLGLALLALASIVMLGLLAGTLRGLRDGSLLAPEPVAAIQPAAGAVSSSGA